jgi:hypothetical protein
MITNGVILENIGKARDYKATCQLIKYFEKIKGERNPFYITGSELEQILVWKLDKQIGRQREIRKSNSEKAIQEISKLAFAECDVNDEYETEIRVGALSLLKGVEIPIASAILALVLPSKYAVIDFRVWHQLFDETKESFSMGDYKKYLHIIREIAKELNKTCQEIDMAIWSYDKK